jgi:hypothetical protein
MGINDKWQKKKGNKRDMKKEKTKEEESKK